MTTHEVTAAELAEALGLPNDGGDRVGLSVEMLRVYDPRIERMMRSQGFYGQSLYSKIAGTMEVPSDGSETK